MGNRESRPKCPIENNATAASYTVNEMQITAQQQLPKTENNSPGFDTCHWRDKTKTCLRSGASSHNGSIHHRESDDRDSTGAVLPLLALPEHEHSLRADLRQISQHEGLQQNLRHHAMNFQAGTRAEEERPPSYDEVFSGLVLMNTALAKGAIASA